MKRKMTQRSASASNQSVDAFLKALLIFSRTVDLVLESPAAQAQGRKPITSSQLHVLRLLGHRGTQTPGRIADFLGVTRPAVTQIVDSMTRARLVKRMPAKTDQREILVSLTGPGRERHRAIQREQRHLVRVLMRIVGAKQAVECTDRLNRLTAGLTETISAMRHFCLQCEAHMDHECVLTGDHVQCRFLQARRRPAASTRTKSGRG